MDGRTLELWFDFTSPYSYLSVMRAEASARAVGAQLVWRPFLLGPIFRALGLGVSPNLQNPRRTDYMWRDVARRARRHGLAWRQPSAFPRNSLLASRVALAAEEAAWTGAFCRAAIARAFAQDEDIADPAVIGSVLDGLGVDAAALLAAAGSEAVKAALRRRNEAAEARGLFGAPTFFAAGDMFWGDDRMEDALAAIAAAG